MTTSDQKRQAGTLKERIAEHDLRIAEQKREHDLLKPSFHSDCWYTGALEQMNWIGALVDSYTAEQEAERKRLAELREKVRLRKSDWANARADSRTDYDYNRFERRELEAKAILEMIDAALESSATEDEGGGKNKATLQGTSDSAKELESSSEKRVEGGTE